jgi:hypothetical protein
MALRVRALRPREFPIATSNFAALIDEELGRRGFAGDVISDMSDYPPQQITGQRQSLGRRAGARQAKRTVIHRGYVRTGQYGRNWRISRIERTRARRSVEVSNLIPYAVYVGGPARGAVGLRQTAVMREKGWSNISEVSRRRWAQHRPLIVRIIAQRDDRLRRTPMPR